MTYDDDNIFAKILRREIPAQVLLEDEHSIAIMDAMPQADGHALVIPKAPSVNLLDAKAESLAEAIKMVQTIAKAGEQAFEADGVIVRQFNNPTAGQSVFHLHFHVIPVKEGVTLKGHAVEFADTELIKSHADKYRAALDGLVH